MTRFARVLGQDVAVTILERAIASDRVASSYLFEGPAGVGKKLAAMALADAVIGGTGSVSRRIEEGSHPDVRVFLPREEGKRNIPVDFLRQQILPFAQFAPFEARAAFLIFPEADVSFPEAPSESANALLKTLEEPRPNVHFILLSERPDRLLPTIRSRCQRVRFGRLPAAVLHALLEARGVGEEARDAAVALALLEQAIAIDDAITAGGPGALVRLGEELARGEQPLEGVLEALTGYYRDVAAAALGLPDTSLAHRHHAARIRERAELLGAARAARRVELLAETRFSFERNANPEIALDALLFALR